VANPYGTVFWPTAYPEVRNILAEPLAAHMSDADIERLVERQLGIEAIDAEDLLSSLSSFWNQAAPVVAKVAPAMIQGGMAGGVPGALIGGGLGILSGLMGGGGQPPPGGPPPAPQPAPQPAAQASWAPSAAPPAAASLMQLLMRPEVQQALMAMLMGSAGKQQVPVAGSQVPLGAFTNAIGQLSQQASVEHHLRAPSGAAVPEYLFESNGALAVADPADPASRTNRLMTLLDRAEMERVSSTVRRESFETHRGIDEAVDGEGYQGLGEGFDEATDEAIDEAIDEVFDEAVYSGLEDAIDESAEDVEALLQPAWS
jgi:hypothetical protein